MTEAEKAAIQEAIDRFEVVKSNSASTLSQASLIVKALKRLRTAEQPTGALVIGG